MKNRIATRKLNRMFLQHRQDSFGMKNLVTTMILPLDSIMMEILAFTTTVILEFGIRMINKLSSMSLVTKTILRQLGLWPMKIQRPQKVIVAKRS